jgi:ABC-type nickel/cobalt efflux system permease component RcnA
MFSTLFLGLLIGIRHAFEADHVAAVASLTSNSSSLRQALRQGAAWGLGHTITLFLFGSVILWMDTVMSESLAHVLEYAVGVMLVVLGIDVLHRVVKERIHYHLHKHDDHVHFHAHSHANESAHASSAHNHTHKARFPVRSLLVGLMHGTAGSAALILLTLETIQSPLWGMVYILLFGIGSILGMALLSVAIAVPLRSSAKGLTWLHNGLQGAIGVLTIGIGGTIMYQVSAAI